MSTKGLKVDPTDMAGKARDTINNADDLRNNFGLLGAQVDDLCTIWTGDASQEFFNSYSDLAKLLNQFNEEMEEYGSNINKAGGMYEDTEAQAAAAARGMF